MKRTTLLLELATIAASVIAVLMLWPHLSDVVPTHWGLDGQVNGEGPRWELFVFGPGMLSVWLGLTFVLPWLSPRQFQVTNFRSTYHQVMQMVFWLFCFIFVMMLWAATGHAMNGTQAVLDSVSLFAVLLGNVMGKVRRNFFIGIRSPWTLASERVWNATHRFAARSFILGGTVALFLSMFVPGPWPMAVLMTGLLLPYLWSLVIYKRLERNGEL